MNIPVLQKIDELTTPVFYTALFATLTILLLLETSGLVLAFALIPLVSSLIAVKVFMTQVLKQALNNVACTPPRTASRLAECNA